MGHPPVSIRKSGAGLNKRPDVIKRQTYSGPMIGTQMCLSGTAQVDVATAGAAEQRLLAFRVPANFRPQAVTWAATVPGTVSGADLTVTFRSTPTLNSVTQNMLNTNPDLTTDESGVAYFQDTSATYYIPGVTSGYTTLPEIDDATYIRAGVSGAGGTGTVTLTVAVFGFFTEHINADRAND